MPIRSLLAAAAVAALLMCLPAGSGAAAKKVTLSGRYARCTAPHPKTYTTCPDVATATGHVLSIQFMVKKKYCDEIAPETPGVWSYFNDLKLKGSSLSGKLDYNNYVPGARDVPDDIGISFRWTGKVISATRIHLVLTGKVTHAGTSVADCRGVKFKETHDLRAVGF